MASIERYTTDAGVRYSVRYRTPSGSQTKKRGFRTKRDANCSLANTEVRKATGDYVAPSLGRVTVGELAVDWLERKRQVVAPKTWFGKEGTCRNHVAPHWASVPVAAIDLLSVEAWITKMVRGGAGAGDGPRRTGCWRASSTTRSRASGWPPTRRAESENLPEGDRQAPRLPDVRRRASAGRRGRRVQLRADPDAGLLRDPLGRGRSVAGARRRVPEAPAGGVAVRVGSRRRAGRWGHRRAARHVRCRCPRSCSTRCRCSAGQGSGRLVFPAPGRVPPVRVGRQPAGSRARCRPPACSASRRTTCGTPARAWLWRPAPTCWRCHGCSGTQQPSMTLDIYADLFDSDLDKVAATMDSRYARAR